MTNTTKSLNSGSRLVSKHVHSKFILKNFPEEVEYITKVNALLSNRLNKQKADVMALDIAYKEGMKEVSMMGREDDRIDAIKTLNKMMKDKGYSFKKHELSILNSATSVPYFARLDFNMSKGNSNLPSNNFYIGKHSISDEKKKMLVIDWRAPLASLYYNYSEPTKNAKFEYEREDVNKPWIKNLIKIEGDLTLRRNFDIEDSTILSVYDNSLKIDLITRSLNKKKGGLLEDIVSTIQDVQNQIITEDPNTICIVQGTAGSGKTTIAIHKISYIFYNFKEKFNSSNTLLLTTSKVLVNYIAKTLPELEVFDITQNTLTGLMKSILVKSGIDLTNYKIIDQKNTQSEILNSIETVKQFDDFLETYVQNVKQSVINHKYYKELGITNLVNRSKDKPLFEFITIIDEYLSEFGKDIKKEIKYGRYTLAYLDKFISEFLNTVILTRDKFDYIKFVIKFYESQSFDTTGFKTKTINIDDLSFIFYLYIKINGRHTDLPIFNQIIVDEGQDLGLLNYQVIKSISNNKGLTVMGDLNQAGTSFGVISDWGDLESLFNIDNIKYFDIKYSYRTTRQIATFAANILLKYNNKSGQEKFKYLPVPFDRDGEEVEILNILTKDEIFNQVIDRVKNIRDSKDFKSIGIIEPDVTNIDKTYNSLKLKIPGLTLINNDFEDFKSDGTYLVPENLVKGLEFSTVIILDPNKKNLPFSPESAKKFFICATRAINKLVIYRVKI